MILHITDGESLEKAGHDFRDLGDPPTTADGEKMSIWAGAFVERVLEYNPDATEQIDVMDRHLSCAENLGEQARIKNANLTRSIQETCTDLAQAFQQPPPVWFSGILSGIDGAVSRLSPDSHELDTDTISRVCEYIPGLSTPLKRYFLRYEDERSTIGRLIRAMDSTQDRQEKNAALMEHQMTDLKRHSVSLAKAIRLGRLIDRTLCDALEREIPRGDARKAFISDHLLLRLRLRIDILRLQMEVNRQSLITLELIRANSHELVRGIQKVKDVVIRTFDRAAGLAPVLTHRRLVRGPLLAGSRAEDPQAGTGLEDLKRDFKDIVAYQQGLISFLSGCLPTVQASIETAAALRNQADDALVNLTLSGKQALIGDIMEMD